MPAVAVQLQFHMQQGFPLEENTGMSRTLQKGKYGESGGRTSDQCVQERHNKTGHERYGQAAQIIVKGFLCFLIIAPPLLFGQELTSSRPAFPDNRW